MRVQTDGLVTTVVDGSTVVLDTTSSTYLTLNAAGTLLFEALLDGTSRTAMTELLVNRFGVDPARAAADCDAFLAQVEARGVLVR